MRRLTAVVVPLVLAAFLSGSAAYAQNVHYKGGKKSGPAFADQGLVLQTCLKLAGLGNGDVTILLEVEGLGSAQCRNPGNGNVVPGQNKVPIEADVSQTVPGSSIKNGNLNICLTTVPPENPSAREAGCPNDNWSARITDVDFESVRITVIQNGVVVLSDFRTL